MITALTTARSARLRTAHRTALGVLVGLLLLVGLALAASALAPEQLDPVLGHLSPTTAILLGSASVLGLVLFRWLDTIGRIGAVMLAVPVVVLTVANQLLGSDFAGAPTGTPLDYPVLLLVPAGHLTLLFGALRSAGWGHRGSWLVFALTAALSLVIMIVPTPPISDSLLANRIVSGALMTAALMTAAIAVLLERGRRASSTGLG
ncbi:hypothetical protein GCM10009792_00940 [Microcella alkalica]|uniref:Uncharacterized protein n=1 Tax=Microcella alkalica TaxID=355930 RepID=A0A839E9I5_9MICO|nr:hypothetical protein [Microcella alkalica]MBA8847833.1 hypothetical protein [Microcella alkalica]